MLTDAELDHRAEVARIDGNYLALELIRELRHHRSRALSAEDVRAENAELRDSLILACELQRASHDNARQLSAMRYVANARSAPFSHARVQERYEEYVKDETPRPPSTIETDYLRKLHDFMIGYAAECDGVPPWVPAAIAVLARLTKDQNP